MYVSASGLGVEVGIQRGYAELCRGDDSMSYIMVGFTVLLEIHSTFVGILFMRGVADIVVLCEDEAVVIFPSFTSD